METKLAPCLPNANKSSDYYACICASAIQLGETHKGKERVERAHLGPNAPSYCH